MKRDRFEVSGYIDSYGASLPLDWEDFRTGSIREDCCVFCGKPHDGFFVYKYDPIQQIRTKKDVYSCRNCQDYVESMIMTTYPDLYEFDVVTNNIIKSHYRDYDEDMSERNARISAFNATRTFPNDVDRYYLHLTLSHDIYCQSALCVFCRKSHMGKYRALEVPVEISSNVTGGRVPVCLDCFQDITDEYENRHIVNQQRCPICNKFYLVDNDELKQRSENGSIGDHMCSECLYRMIQHVSGEKSLLYDKDNLSPRKFPLNRFLFKECSKCGGQFIIDLTIDFKISIREHSIDAKHTTRCKTCFLLFTSKSNNNKFWIKVKENYYIVFTKTGKFWNYIVAKVVYSQNKSIKLYECTDQYEDAVECGAAAFREAVELINSPQQKLWDQL